MWKSVGVVFTFFVLGICESVASARGLDAHRDPDVSFTEYLRKIPKTRTGATPVDLKISLASVSVDSIPEFESVESLQTAFEYVRDLRFAVDPDISNGNLNENLRRSSWLWEPWSGSSPGCSGSVADS